MAIRSNARRIVQRLLTHRRGKPLGSRLVRLTPDKPVIGRVLMSYATKVYLDLVQGKGIDRTHVSAWKNFNISRTFLDLGFEVDVIHFEDEKYIPDRSYDVVFDIVSNLSRIADSQSSNLIKILYPMFSHWTMHNSRSYARHLALAQRRGVAILPNRLLTPNNSVERADHILCVGGEFGRGTYSFSDTAVMPIHQVSPLAINEFVDRKFEQSRRNFVWIGGSGVVHKGLDLVLESFAALPDLNLTVIGNVTREKQFTEVYNKELFNLPNIRAVGWLDTLSDEYRAIVSNAVALVAPSATELSCGSVIAGMMAGLIPITTEGADIDVAGIGVPITKDTVDGVRQAILVLTGMSDGDIGDLSRESWKASQQRYGKGKFLQSFRTAICEAVGLNPVPEWQSKTDEEKIPRIELL